MQSMFTSSIIFIKHAELKKMDEKWLDGITEAPAFCYCPEKYKKEENLLFFG